MRRGGGGGGRRVYESSSPYASIVGIFEKTDSGRQASRVHAVPEGPQRKKEKKTKREDRRKATHAVARGTAPMSMITRRTLMRGTRRGARLVIGPIVHAPPRENVNGCSQIIII